MKQSSKKIFLNKKNIIIVLGIVIILTLLVYILFFKEPSEKLMKCTMSIDNYAYAAIEMNIDAYYTKNINRLEGKINFEVTDESLKLKIEELEQNLKKSYGAIASSEGVFVDVIRDNNTIILEYRIDYKKISSNDINNFNMIPIIVDNDIKEFTKDEFKIEIENSGGICIEE